MAWLMGSLGAIPFDREGSGLSGLKESLRQLKRGEMVLVFPEGTRSGDGELGPLRPGFTALAVRSQAAILPVAIEGAFQAWPRWRKFPGRGTIRIHFGRPILPAEIAACEERKLAAEVEQRLRECQAILRDHAACVRAG
jgi:1-acyl-sn-glycerol-3-phosphate acyltransferase